MALAVLLISVMVLGSYQGNVAQPAQASPAERASAAAEAAAPGDGVPVPLPPFPEGPPGEPEPEPHGRAQPAGPSEPVPDPVPPPVPRSGSGAVRVAQFTRAAPVEQTGRTVRVRVEVENEMPTDPEVAAAQAADILQDARSWSSKQRVRFAFVGAGGHDLVIRILTPTTTDTRCLPLRTLGEVSCSVGSAVNVNGIRWETGVPDYAGDLDGYRTYLINHEVGHYLGRGHVECPGPGKPAPVMMQQTKGLDGCARNPWP
ncbi:DUF3152 domain-containing protein [Granulicoccus sp. GXG6511]|uniref:DUF3152 domain-containing protein n=1 Tax=Granulicoccus sp. GXG6511 TaxID=3381351 RepID=UPI003D7C85D6